MKLILLTIYMLHFFSHCQSAEDFASKADMTRLENTIKDLTEKIASVNILEYAYRFNQMDANLKYVAKSIEEIKDSSTTKCDCNGGSSESPASVTGDQSVKSLLENGINTLEQYGNKLLPGHSSILKGQQTVIQKIGEVTSLIQTGITKILTSLSAVGDFNSYIEGMEAQIITSIEDENTVVSKQQTILEEKLQEAVDGITIRQSKFDKALKGIKEFMAKKLEESTDTINANHQLTEKLIMDLEGTALTKRPQANGSTAGKLPTRSSCYDLKSELEIVNAGIKARDTSLHDMYTQWTLCRNNLIIQWSRQSSKARSLCNKSDKFLKNLVNANKTDVEYHISNLYTAANDVCRNIKTDHNDPYRKH